MLISLAVDEHDPTTALEPWPHDAAVSEAEVATCQEILTRLWKRDPKCKLFSSKHGRQLRCAIGPFARKMQQDMFGGVGRSEFEHKKIIRTEEMGRQAQLKAQDEAQVNKTMLRQRRLQMLADLTKRQDPALPLVPDGFVPEVLDAKAMSDINGMDVKAEELKFPRACYICKARFRNLHTFYDRLCPACAELNFRKRSQSCDLEGRVALVTGGRVKIGFCVALKLLRWGASVLVTSRFPCNAAKRFAAESDYSNWRDRLTIYGLDFRDIRSVEAFCKYIHQTRSRLDILVNNACQTIRRPAAYYRPFLEEESLNFDQLGEELRPVLLSNQHFAAFLAGSFIPTSRKALCDADGDRRIETCFAAAAIEIPNTFAASAGKSQMALLPDDCADLAEVLPAGAVDVNMQQLDLRKRNTWIMRMEEIQTAEVVEVLAINALAPFILNSSLAPLMRCSGPPGTRRFIINVSAMEGKFYRVKSAYHPHTNMAKAALNMLTRTSAEDLSKADIFMTAVDTGWINDENPVEKAQQYAERHNFQTPLDEVDAAARILDPVVSGLNDEGTTPTFGVFLKDYLETEW